MIRRFVVALAVVALATSGFCRGADLRDPVSDGVDTGQWELQYSSGIVPLTVGSRYVQVFSDRRVHWNDATRDVRTLARAPFNGAPRCADDVQLGSNDMDAMRSIVRAMYALEIPDQPVGAGVSSIILTVTRDGKSYIAGMVHYQSTLENLDARLKAADAIFRRYGCPSDAPTPAPARPKSGPLYVPA